MEWLPLPSPAVRNLDYPAPLTSLMWPDPADLSSTTSTGSSVSSQRMQNNSYSKHWSSPTWTTAICSWLDSQPLRLNWCRAVKNAAVHLVFNLPKFSHGTLHFGLHWLPFAARIRHQWNCTCLPPDTGQTTPSMSTSLHYISGLASSSITEIKQPPAQPSRDSSRPMAGQQSHSPSSAKDSRCAQTLLRPCIAWPSPKKHICTCMFLPLPLKS